jgi:pimeloyl-ACP methyl ester carboxylesterase
MERFRVDGVELEYQVQGAGEPVVLVHGALFADGLRPLADEPALAASYQVITYNRVGYGGSSRPRGPVTINDQAAHTAALLRHLGVPRAHVVGHSSGGMIALQLAHDAPAAVGTLALLEMPDRGTPSWGTFARTWLGPAFQRYGSGDTSGGIDAFLAALCGTEEWAALKRTLPAAVLTQTAADADSYFGVEAASTQQWHPEDAAVGVSQPVLVVLGARSAQVDAVWAEGHDAMLRRLPSAEPYLPPGATHLLQWQNPGELAITLADFYRRHPLDSAGAPTQSAGARQ